MRSLVPSRISETKSFQVFPKSLKIRGAAPRGQNNLPPERSEIYQFSANSRRRLRFVALNAWPVLVSQYCLTYHNNYPTDGIILKSHFHRFRASIRKVLCIKDYLWILEFQKRGAPHFHLFLSVQPSKQLQERLTQI
jgi:hypothetical protein